MLKVRLSIFRFFIPAFIVCLPGSINAQRRVIDSLAAMKPMIDTSEYIPSFYPGALDYNLMIAASKGYDSEIERLIGKGANVNSETQEGATPLIFAVSNNKLSAVKTLLYYNPILDIVTMSYETPLLIAVKESNFEIAEALMRAGAEIDCTDRHGATPLHYASLYGFFDIVDLLLYYGASVDIKSEEGTTPLMASIWAGYSDIADLLIQNGANMEVRDNDGFTPFLMASFNGDTLLMDLLYKQGVDIYVTNTANHNALTLSILTGHSKATEFLLKIGDKWTTSGKNIFDPYVVASKYQRKEIIRILEKNNLPGKLKYEIDQVNMSVSSRFCLNDIYTGASLSFREPYLNGGIITGCDMKLWYTRVLSKKSDDLYYQYMDKGSVAYAGLFKDFTLTRNAFKGNCGFSTSLSAGYAFGNKLKGTRIGPENKLMIVPAISFNWTKKNLSLSLGMTYLKTEYYHNGSVWFRIGSSYNFYFDNVRTKSKTIKWN
jgi:ankyrin repeat protein